MQTYLRVLLAGLLMGSLFSAGSVLAQEKSVAEEILDILKANNQISEEQYQTLLKKARAEEETVQEAVKVSTPEPTDFRVYWNNGLRFDTTDKNFRLRIGGRIQHDWSVFDTDREIRNDVNNGFSIGDGTRFRRVRLNIQGDIYQTISFRTQYEFAGGNVALRDVYLQLKELSYVGNLMVGHFKEPYGLEELTSTNNMTFMERGLSATFSPVRNTGAMLHNTLFDQRVSWAVGAFREADDTTGNGFGENSPYSVTARFTAVPWYEDKGEQLLHLGFSYNHKFRDDANIRYRARPESGFGPRFVDTGAFAANGVDLITPEVALVYGPFSVQGEYTRAFIDADAVGDPEFQAFYVYGSYFLTGEHRPYRTGRGVFGGIQPKNNFGANGGWGAWEVAARYSHIDLNDKGIRGGELGDFTFGMNWYLNPNLRFMFNYVHADLEDSGAANIIQSRFQVAF